MGAFYTRQSSYSDGDVIQASDTNNEFDQLLATFASSSGHTHDGTEGEGGPITALLGNTLSFGDGSTDLDIVINFNANGNDGELKWMEDEDYFEFSDDILIASTEKIQFGDTASFIQQSSDGVLRIDGEVNINLNASSNVDVSNDIRLRSDSSLISFGADSDVSLTHVADTALLLNSSRQLQFGDSGTYIHQSTDGQLDLVADTEIQIAANTVDINGNVDISGTLTIGSAGISEAELEILDGATVTTTELNILDGDTSASSTTVADADRVVLNDGGTMKQVAVTDLSAYFDDEITAMPNLTSVGTLTTLTVDNVIVNGTTIGHTDDTDLITLADGIATVAGEISVTTLDIGGTNVTSTAAELNILDGVTSTATELNIMDGGTSASSTTLADADRVVVNDAGTMKQVALTDFETYFESALDTLSNVTTVGALNSGSITSGFGAINNGSSAITTTGTVTYGSLSDGTITITAFVDEDDMSSNSATLVPTQQSVKAYVDTQLTAEDLDVTSDSGTIAIDLDSETLTVAGGEGIDTSATGNTVTIAGEDATTSNKGIASFSSDNFSVSSGAVTIKDGGVVTAEIAADAITEAKIADNAVESEHINDNVISGQSALTSGLATTDELLVSDAGTIKRMDVSVLTALTDDNATALAIALG